MIELRFYWLCRYQLLFSCCNWADVLWTYLTIWITAVILLLWLSWGLMDLSNHVDISCYCGAVIQEIEPMFYGICCTWLGVWVLDHPVNTLHWSWPYSRSPSLLRVTRLLKPISASVLPGDVTWHWTLRGLKELSSQYLHNPGFVLPNYIFDGLTFVPLILASICDTCDDNDNYDRTCYLQLWLLCFALEKPPFLITEKYSIVLFVAYLKLECRRVKKFHWFLWTKEHLRNYLPFSQ